jgi:hypothetical protein
LVVGWLIDPGYGDNVLRVEELEKELDKLRKHSTLLQSKLDTAFA